MIEVRNLTFEYPNQLALDDVSFNIERNTITALVGPNGAGKTTLLKCLSALIKPYRGEIYVDGNDIIEDPRSVNKVIGFMPDFFGLYDNLTVRQAMRYYAMAYDLQIDNLRTHITDIIERVNLQDKLNEKIGSLSRGMRQRMAIAQSIVHNPKLLLLDEPASGLDPEARSSLTELFIDLNKADMTIIVSSHILSELDDYATNLVVLKEGQIIEKNVSKDVIRNEERILCISTVDPISNYKHIFDEGGLQARKQDDLHIEFTFNGSIEEQNQLLNGLLKKGVKISEFYIKKSKLQDHYTNLMKN